MLKFTLTRERLRAGLDAVSSVIPTNTTLPVLSNVLIETVGPDKVRFSGSDLDVAVRRSVPAEVHAEGGITVPARKLQEIAREISADLPIEISVQGDTVAISSGRTRFRLNGLPLSEFPTVPVIDWNVGAKVQGATLKEMISHTSFAVSTEDTRPILNGIFWENKNGQMRMVATNGHRLAKFSTPTNGDQPLDRDFIVHPKALARVEKIFEPDTPIEIGTSENSLGFRTEEAEVLTRLIEGPYPNYEQVIPTDNDKVLLVDRKEMVAAVRRMSIVASDQTHRIRMDLGATTLRFSVATPDLGEASEDLPVEYTGEPLGIGFNAQYILEVLKYVPGDKIKILFKAPERAAIVRPADEDMPDFEALLMPLRLLD